MTQYINKDVLIAEIERVIDEPTPPHDQQCPWEDGYYCGLNKSESIINTLKVKEVDLEKEYKMFVNYDEGRSMFETAIYFFELGLKAQKGE